MSGFVFENSAAGHAFNFVKYAGGNYYSLANDELGEKYVTLSKNFVAKHLGVRFLGEGQLSDFLRSLFSDVAEFDAFVQSERSCGLELKNAKQNYRRSAIVGTVGAASRFVLNICAWTVPSAFQWTFAKAVEWLFTWTLTPQLYKTKLYNLLELSKKQQELMNTMIDDQIEITIFEKSFAAAVQSIAPESFRRVRERKQQGQDYAGDIFEYIACLMKENIGSLISDKVTQFVRDFQAAKQSGSYQSHFAPGLSRCNNAYKEKKE